VTRCKLLRESPPAGPPNPPYRSPEKNIDFFISNERYSRTIEQVSLITTRKFSLVLFVVIRRYFTFDWKYFYICMISGLSSFEWYINEFSSSMSDREMSGLRSWAPSVVIRSTVPNFHSKQFFVPNYDTHTKFKQNPIFEIKQVFSRIFIGKRAKVSKTIL